jgi:phospholipid/cholesterol/gamma-HCH transport system substrate-binding protein
MNETTQISKERFYFRHVHAVTGTFVLIVLAVVISIVVLAGRSQRWFIGNVTLRIILPEDGAAGIRQGSEVYFLGTLMGTVWDVVVEPTGRMEAQVNIRRDFFRFVRDDSSAVVKRKFGVVGDAYFEITRGHGKTLPEKNASIVCNEQLPSALESAVEEVRREAVPALRKLTIGLDSWTTLGSNLVASRHHVDALLLRADAIIADLQMGKGTAGKLLTDPSIATELESMLAKSSRSIDDLQITLQNLQEASANLRLASTNLPAITETLSNEAQDLPGLVLQTQVSMRELQRLIEGMQQHWLWRKYMNHTNPPALRDRVNDIEPVPTPVKILRSPRGSAR